MANELTIPVRPSLVGKLAERFEIEPNKFLAVLVSTALKPYKEEDKLSNEEIAAFLVVANQFELNPFLKEIFGFKSKGKLLVVVSVDGWSKIINRQGEMNGMEFEEDFDDNGAIFSITCRIHRKDRSIPTVVTEYYKECYRETEPWKKSPIRMLRHKALIQCARYAFSIAGLVDEEEAQDIDPSAAKYGKIVEGSTSDAEAEIRKLAKKLGWNKAKTDAFLGQYRTDMAAGLSYMQAQMPKEKTAVAEVIEERHYEPIAGEAMEGEVIAGEVITEAKESPMSGFQF